MSVIRVFKTVNDDFLIAQLPNLDLLCMRKDKFASADETNNCLATSA